MIEAFITDAENIPKLATTSTFMPIVSMLKLIFDEKKNFNVVLISIKMARIMAKCIFI